MTYKRVKRVNPIIRAGQETVESLTKKTEQQREFRENTISLTASQMEKRPGHMKARSRRGWTSPTTK